MGGSRNHYGPTESGVTPSLTQGSTDPRGWKRILAIPPYGERGITPVIGIILIVVLVAVLSGIVSAMAFSLTDQPVPAPQAVWDAEVQSCGGSDDGTVRLRHQGGQETTMSPLVVHYHWDNDTRTELQQFDLPSTGVVEAGDVAHERRVDEPDLLTRITLVWEEADKSYILAEFTPAPPFQTASDCLGAEVEPGFVVEADEPAGNGNESGGQGDESGDCDGSEPAQDRGHGNECDGEDDNNPAGGDDPMTGAN